MAGISAIYSCNGGSLVPIVKSTDPAPFPSGAGDTLFSFSRPVIAGGVTAFTADHGSGGNRSLFTGTGGPLNTLVKPGDPSPAPGVKFGSVLQGSAIDGNTVAFASDPGLFTDSGGVITTIVKINDAAPSGTFSEGFYPPSISGGNVAFGGVFGSGSFGIFTSRGGSKTTIVKTGDPAPTGTFTNFVGGSTDNYDLSGDTVAFFANYKSTVFPLGSGSGIFTGNGGAITAIAKTGDPGPFPGPMQGFSSPTIAGNWVAFLALYNGSRGSGGPGIIARNGGGPLVSVIHIGDTLFGSTVTNLAYSSFGLDTDGSGRLAFQYQLLNGVNGIAIAEPVPEPTSLTLFYLGLVSLALPTRRFKRNSI